MYALTQGCSASPFDQFDISIFAVGPCAEGRDPEFARHRVHSDSIVPRSASDHGDLKAWRLAGLAHRDADRELAIILSARAGTLD